MRYRKGYIALSDSRDVPVLLLIRNARAITFDQVCALAAIEGNESSRRSVYWRLSRLEGCELIRRMTYDRFFSQPIFAITPLGLQFLEFRGHSLLSLPSTAKSIIRKSQILHSVELAGTLLQLVRDHVASSLDGREPTFELHASGGLPGWRAWLRRGGRLPDDVASFNHADCLARTRGSLLPVNSTGASGRTIVSARRRDRKMPCPPSIRQVQKARDLVPLDRRRRGGERRETSSSPGPSSTL